ncbi:MAG: hypothetical protein Tsb002_04900 [Wenzhouxiangellaceae bacterium]
MYQPAAHWLWDFWLAHDGRQHHLFYLQAPRMADNAEARHVHAAIGHAISDDLRDWREQGEALSAAATPAWDDRCIWTGSIIDCAASNSPAYAMLYTGTSQHEGGVSQRIGLAWSDDLNQWRRAEPSLVLEHDAAHYAGPQPAHAGEQAWRDPHLFHHPQGGYGVLLCAQVSRRGQTCAAIALARSSDLRHWRTAPPILISRAFYLLEIPQLVYIDNHYYLLVSAMAEWIDSDQLPGSPPPMTGTYYFHSSQLDRGWRYGGCLCGSAAEMQYGLKLVEHQQQWYGLYWRGYSEDGVFLGDLSAPLAIDISQPGKLRVVDR